MKAVFFFFAVIGVLLLSAPATGLAQQAPAAGPTTVKRLELFVTDDKGKSLNDLHPSDLQLKEDGLSATVDSLELIETPVHYGLLIDVSNSLRSQFPSILDAARKVISSNTRDDETFIIRFTDKVEMIQTSTANKLALFQAIDQLRPAPGQTALFDALYMAATELQKIREPNRRKALVIITDGENRKSSIKESKLFDLLQETDFPIFIIGLTEDLDRTGGLIRQSLHDRSIVFLEKLARESGGRLFFLERNIERHVDDEIAGGLRRRYLLKYRSPGEITKSRHKVEIKVADAKDKKKRRAVHRPWYTNQQLREVNN
ncbi:MAG TPA: VWA domain-containing protein [Pyrinomonadaceae bacterium]|nr:VWA domain-containing protein [Pyrinomonadaceae bacterium]